MPYLSPNQQCQTTYGEKEHSSDLLTPSSAGVFQLCFWPLKAPGYRGGGLPCHAMFRCHYPSLTYALCNVIHHVSAHVLQHTDTHIILMDIFTGKPGLASCPLIFLTRGFGAKIYGLDALSGTNQQKHTGLHHLCSHYDSWVNGRNSLCICSMTSVTKYKLLEYTCMQKVTYNIFKYINTFIY